MTGALYALVGAVCAIAIIVGVAGVKAVIQTTIEKEYDDWAPLAAKGFMKIANRLQPGRREEWAGELATARADGRSGITFAIECCLGSARLRLVRVLHWRPLGRRNGAVETEFEVLHATGRVTLGPLRTTTTFGTVLGGSNPLNEAIRVIGPDGQRRKIIDIPPTPADTESGGR